MLLFLFFFPSLILGLPNPDPASIQPFHPNPSPPTTIPAFPEQSNLAGCPLSLSDELFHGIKSACSGHSGSSQLRRSRCCPVLAAWLYSAYSATALRAGGGRVVSSNADRVHPTSYDMPLLPDDSETCVDSIGKSLKDKGIELVNPNETCDVVYCYCGIRLHPLSCPDAFWVNEKGNLEGDKRVERLERDCLSSSNVNGFPGLGGCSKCLKTLYLLNDQKPLNSSKPDDRTIKIHNKDCQLMGLTWLLAKNRTAYIHTVSTVLRAMMMSPDGSDPQSCTLTSDGMPLAVDSTEISNNSFSITHQGVHFVTISFICLCIFLAVSSTKL